MKTWLPLLLGVFALVTTGAAAEPRSLAEPAVLNGTVLARGSSNLLFRFKRTATREGDTVRSTREFTAPDGTLAARERCTYAGGKLTSFHLDLIQAGAQGSTAVAADPGNPRKQKLTFTYTTGSGSRAKMKNDSETTEGEVLVGDMIPYFIVSHWETLMRGQPASFRFIAQERLETVGFKLVKEGELKWDGKPVVRLRMEPTSAIIAALVDPLFFFVEKEGGHRVLQYDGRTTPKARQGNAWKDLDAINVYAWD